MNSGARGAEGRVELPGGEGDERQVWRRDAGRVNTFGLGTLLVYYGELVVIDFAQSC